MPAALFDLGSSVFSLLLASLAAGLGLGVWLPGRLSGVAGVDVGLWDGGVELRVAFAALDTLRLAGVEMDVVVV